MKDDLLSYYNSELAYLRELGSEFADDYPKIAARLKLDADKCEDPHVERLLEGVALLSARVRKKLDDELPEITDAFLSVLYPHFLRPLPSMSIVEFRPSSQASGQRVAAGTRLNSRPVGGSPCSFRTIYPVDLWPIEVSETRLDPDRVVLPGKPAGSVGLLRITLRCQSAANFGALPLQALRFHLDGEGPTPFELYELLFNNVSGVWIRGDPEGGGADGGRTETIKLPDDAIRPVGLGRDEGMIPYPTRSFPGYRLIQEYFAFPQKFLFFDVSGLEALRTRRFGSEVELLIFLDRPPRTDIQVTPGNFKLYCSPVVNLFPLTAEPIILDQTQFEYRVVPDVQRAMSTEVYSIDRVSSTGSFLEEPVHYDPFYSLHHTERENARRPYWFASRRPSHRKEDPGTELYLTFVDSAFNPRIPDARTVTVQATCTNRDLPARLPFGGDQGDFELEAQAPVSRARCLRKPTRTLRPPLGRGAQWRLISHLALNHLSITDSEEGLAALQEILRIYDFAGSSVSRQQVEGITRVSCRRVAGRTSARPGNAVCLGVEVDIEFDESNYVGSGTFLLASVLERFLGLYVSVNSFTRLVARTKQREGILKRWRPRSGERTLV